MTTIPSERPTLKLGIAFAGMCVLMLQYALRELQKLDFAWTGWLMAAGITCIGIRVSWVGIFRSAFLHWLWGWMCLLAGLFALALLTGHIMGWLHSTAPPWEFLPEALALPVTSWLLLVDRDVARYRTHLQNLENKRSKLRLED